MKCFSNCKKIVFPSTINQSRMFTHQSNKVTSMTMAQQQKIKRSDLINKHRVGLHLRINEALTMSYIKTFGFKLQLTPRVPAELIEIDEPVEDETAKYEFKPRKTRKAFDGRQQSRKGKTIELNKDIRKSKKNFTKIMITNTYISSLDATANNKMMPITTKPSKREAYTKTKIRSNKRNYKSNKEVTAAAANL